MKNLSIIILALATILFSSCFSEEKQEETGKKIAEGIFEKILEKAAAEDGKNIDVDIDLDKAMDGGGMTITDENGKEIKITGDDGELKISGEDGEEVTFSGNTKEIPDNFPKDVYLVKGEIESVGNMNSKKGSMITVVIKPENSKEDVISKIKNEMKSNGWKSEMDMNMGGEAMFIYKKDKNSATITINGKDKDLKAAYMVTTSDEK